MARLTWGGGAGGGSEETLKIAINVCLFLCATKQITIIIALLADEVHFSKFAENKEHKEQSLPRCRS
ncbi:unnamed protein product [Ceratitis capitata]|uniref:(Mediterranean fruit fly) hypothetical protein n=1 Tax=Ceratitis capitata TaxID=7213 RepID=A0A811USV1_CERCA|nr:unnamed protein product [Ceratitis capitata]